MQARQANNDRDYAPKGPLPSLSKGRNSHGFLDNNLDTPGVSYKHNAPKRTELAAICGYPEGCALASWFGERSQLERNPIRWISGVVAGGRAALDTRFRH